MRKYLFLPICLLALCFSHAQMLWYKADSLLSLPTEDTIPATDEYTAMTVVRSLNSDTSQLLWGFIEDDTLSRAVLTDGIFVRSLGVMRSSEKRDFSRWNIYYYHAGCSMDTTQSHILHLGSATAHYVKDSIEHSEILHADISMEEFLWYPRALTRLESESLLTYLALKYGITLDEDASYLTPTGDTLWSSSADGMYYHRVVGVGTDTIHGWNSCLSQTKERAEMLIRCTALQSGDYVLLGDNDGTHDWLPLPDGSYRLERQWRLRKNNPAMTPIVLEWTPAVTDLSPDSIWLVLTDASDRETGRYQVATIVADSLWQFPVLLSDTLLTLHVESVGTSPAQRHKPRANNSTNSGHEHLSARYSADGRLTIAGLSTDVEYVFHLYDSTGKLVQVLHDVADGTVFVGPLPTGVYHIEILQHNNIIGDVRIVVK